MRVLITGARGFVGPYVAGAIRNICGAHTAVVATAKEAGEHPAFGPIEALDITDPAAIRSAIDRHAPTHILHLAGIAAPAVANADPQAAWRVHVEGTLNLARVILDWAPDCWLLHVGSGLVYGESAGPGLPLDEDTLLAPVDEYSVTKAAADLALGALAKRGLKCIRFRPFNHTGAGQSEAFVVPAFALQIARIERRLAPPVIRVGNLDAERDFLDVRDVAAAYARAIVNPEGVIPGTILNIASGSPQKIENVLYQLLARSHVEISVERDQERLRRSDLPRIVGDAHRAREILDWTPKHPFEDTLAAVLDHWREIVNREFSDAGRDNGA